MKRIIGEFSDSETLSSRICFTFTPHGPDWMPWFPLIGTVVPMENAQSLVKTLDFQLNIQNESEDLLREVTFEARNAYNEVLRLAKEGFKRSSISTRVTEYTNLVKNTTQRIVDKTETLSIIIWNGPKSSTELSL